MASGWCLVAEHASDISTIAYRFNALPALSRLWLYADAAGP